MARDRLRESIILAIGSGIVFGALAPTLAFFGLGWMLANSDRGRGG